MTLSHHGRRIGRILGAALAVVCLHSFPARASVIADFNGDGVLDQVVAARSPISGLIVSISGSSTPLVLKLSEPPLSFVAADVDRDGDVDLILSKRHGLLVWLNRGRGRFTVSHRHSLPRSLQQQPRLQILPADALQDSEALGQTNDPACIGSGHTGEKVLCLHLKHSPPFSEPTLATDRADSCESRAPPSIAAA
jgi:hypothetical protein